MRQQPDLGGGLSAETDKRPLLGRIAAGCGGTVATLCFGVTAVCFGGRQVVSSVAPPGFLDSVGLGWLELRPAPPAELDASTHDCELSWWRNGFGTLAYRLECTAEGEDIEISELHLAAIDASDWASGAWTADKTLVHTYEEQWPMDEETIPIDEGRTWTYDGTMNAGMADWFGGAPRALIWTATIGHPERNEDEVEELCRERTECVVELVSIEPAR